METSLCGTKRQEIIYVRASPRRRPLQLSLLLNKGLYSAKQASTSQPLTHPFSKRPSNSLFKSCRGATLSSPITIASRNSLFFVLRVIVRRQWTAYNSQIRQGSGGHHGEIRFSNSGLQFCARCHHARHSEIFHFINGRRSGVIRGNIFLPMLYKWRRSALF